MTLGSASLELGGALNFHWLPDPCWLPVPWIGDLQVWSLLVVQIPGHSGSPFGLLAFFGISDWVSATVLPAVHIAGRSGPPVLDARTIPASGWVSVPWL